MRLPFSPNPLRSNDSADGTATPIRYPAEPDDVEPAHILSRARVRARSKAGYSVEAIASVKRAACRLMTLPLCHWSSTTFRLSALTLALSMAPAAGTE